MKTPNMRDLCAALCCGAAVSMQAFAQPYPSKPIRAILALGGGGEALARLIGQKMSDAMGQPVLIDPQPAATGSIAASTVARAAPDGYTILYAATNSQVYRPILVKNTPYDPVRDFTPIAMLSEAVLVLVASTESGIVSARDLVERARANPGKVFYGTSGVGTTHHLSAELLQSVTGIKLAHVPYKDPAQVAVEVIANRLPVGFAVFGTVYQHHLAGKLRIVAVNNTKRFARIKDIPTLGEGVPGYTPPPGWNGFFGPAKMPQPVVQRLNAEIGKAASAPDLRDKIDALGFIITLGAPEELGVALRESLERTQKIVKAAGIPQE
ncbi:MAG: tripartite tricarboxylate transporter substrate binding protein [Burkholderiales bacterium]|nr:tripartite tricarboxylate transporter substrate binding protein [Burkholderiales bacterium]